MGKADFKKYSHGESQPMLIRDMATDERPREKAIKYGIKSLTNTELMAIIFGTGVSGKSVVQLSNDILADNGNHLSQVARLSVKDLLNRYKGIGPAKAVSLLAALEIGSRSAADAASISTPTITSSEIAVHYMRRYFNNLPHEEFWVMLLSQSGRLIREVNIARGGVSSTAVDVRIIMKCALENLAASLILFHNHPSGNLRPSVQDETLTKQIIEAAKLFNIRVNDHIIIADSGYFSFRDEGII